MDTLGTFISGSSGNTVYVYWDSANRAVIFSDVAGSILVQAPALSRQEALDFVTSQGVTLTQNPADAARRQEAERMFQRGLEYDRRSTEASFESLQKQREDTQAKRQEVATKRIASGAGALKTIMTAGGVPDKKSLEIYDSPALREMSFKMDWKKGGKGQSLAALKNVTNLPESDMRSATLPAVDKDLNRPSSPHLSNLRNAVRPEKSAQSMNNPAQTVRRSAPDLSLLQASTTPRLRRVQSASQPSSARSIPVGQFVKPPTSPLPGAQVMRPVQPPQQIGTRLGQLVTQRTNLPIGQSAVSRISQVAKQPVVFKHPTTKQSIKPAYITDKNPTYNPQVLSVKNIQLGIKGHNPSYYGKKIKQLKMGVR